jgi:uncharacterized protein (TIGR02996 family)
MSKSPLTRARSLVDDPPALLEALVDAWAETPALELAELIDRVTALARTNPPGLRGKTKAAKAAWDTLAAKRRAADLPALLEALADVSSGDAQLRLVALGRPAPHVDAALVALAEVAPYRATMTRPFWKAMFARMGEIRDPRLIARLADPELFAGVAETQRDWLRNRRDDLLEDLRALGPPPPSPSLAGLADRIAAPAATHDLAALERAVFANPDDDAPRLVLADALLEAGDPRGELIALQCRETLDKEQRAREKELIASHGKTWLGPLAPILRASFRFERGFLAACEVNGLKAEIIAELVGHPTWATVRELAGSPRIALDPIMRSLRVLEFSAYEARNTGLPEGWRDLLVDVPRTITSLRFRPRTEEPPQLAALRECKALAALTSLTIFGAPEEAANALIDAPILARLDHLGFSFDRTPTPLARVLGWFAPHFEAARVPTFRVELGPDYHTTELVLEREGSRYARGKLTIGPTSAVRPNWQDMIASEAMAILAALPDVAFELVARRGFTQTEQVQQHLEQRGAAPRSPPPAPRSARAAARAPRR